MRRGGRERRVRNGIWEGTRILLYGIILWYHSCHFYLDLVRDQQVTVVLGYQLPSNMFLAWYHGGRCLRKATAHSNSVILYSLGYQVKE